MWLKIVFDPGWEIRNSVVTCDSMGKNSQGSSRPFPQVEPSYQTSQPFLMSAWRSETAALICGWLTNLFRFLRNKTKQSKQPKKHGCEIWTLPFMEMLSFLWCVETAKFFLDVFTQLHQFMFDLHDHVVWCQQKLGPLLTFIHPWPAPFFGISWACVKLKSCFVWRSKERQEATCVKVIEWKQSRVDNRQQFKQDVT